MAKFSSLRDKALKLNSLGGIPFMEGRTKGELPEGTICTMDDYGFAKNENGDEYAVLSFAEYPQTFFFGGSVVTEKLKVLDMDLDETEKQQLREEGVPVTFVKKKNKKGKREYMTCEFFPEDEEE